MNLRVQYPLWNIIGTIPLLLIGWGIILLEGVDKNSSFGIVLQSVILVGITLFILYTFIYILLVKRYNTKNPKQKINPFSLRPNEYIENDEMFKQVTMSATKKVYSFMYWALPSLLGITLGAENRFMIYLGIIIIIIIQNLIFYKEVKQYISGHK